MTSISRRQTLFGLGAGSLVLPAAPALANTPVGTVDIEQVQVAFIGSGNVGGGTLHFQGKTYRFNVGGLGVGGFGVSKMQAHGEVYNMKDVSQFAGAYGQGRTGIAVADQSAGKLWLQNTHGVVLQLRAKRSGLALSMGADAVIITLK
jgi:hypothetical protein